MTRKPLNIGLLPMLPSLLPIQPPDYGRFSTGGGGSRKIATDTIDTIRPPEKFTKGGFSA